MQHCSHDHHDHEHHASTARVKHASGKKSVGSSTSTVSEGSPTGGISSTRQAGVRQTKQREAVLKALRDANAPVTAKQILGRASKHAEGMGLATVYRTLKLLIASGEAQPVDIPGVTPLFEISGKGHHHHFVCTNCETVFELEGGCCGHFDDLAPKGFRTVAHELSLFGTCDRCNASPAKAKEASARPRTRAR
jgi:Fur family ferric uptake transcriptional regulator